ncbi:hypothetical protein B0H13DRAFT_2351908 [Mycena leptocephala]|nr:hypothetical protein B0H13DRAFT_2351908 [Mycena leptocephala]
MADQGPVLKAITLNPGSWKEEEKLALEKGNYRGWATRVWNTIGLHSGATRWLDPNEQCPSLELYPRQHRIWQDNNVAILSYITLLCASSEHAYFEHCKTAAEAWAALRARHTRRGPLDQVNKLRAAMGMQFADDPESWVATLEKISELNKAVWAGEAPTADGIHTVLLLHALSPFPAFVDSLLAVPELDAAYITSRLNAKQQMPRSSSSSSPAAFAATNPKSNSEKKKRTIAITLPAQRPLVILSLTASRRGGDGREIRRRGDNKEAC